MLDRKNASSLKKTNIGKHEMNLCEGSLFWQIIVYSIPLILTNLLQMLFNAADVAVLGIFTTDEAVAAVGSTGALINLILSLFIGLSVGVNVLIARSVGENTPDRAEKIVGTSVTVSLIIGVFLAGFGYFCSRIFLEWMGCDPEVIDMAEDYMQIYFLGVPVILLYNFCAAVLRAVGDTVRPLIFLVISGIANFLLNILTVTAFDLGVKGVAIATVTSSGISAVLSIYSMLHADGFSKLKLSALRIDGKVLWSIAKIGLPAGLQGSVFSISNVLIQSSYNSLGKTVMAGNTIGGQIDSFVYMAMYGVALSTVAFVSQNLGAGKLERVRKSVRLSLGIVAGLGIVIGGLAYLLRDPLISIYTDDPEVARYAAIRIFILALPYFSCGLMDCMSSAVRGLGKSTTAMVVSLLGSCVSRIIWLNTVFLIPEFHTYEMICVIYPISWFLTFGIYLLLYFPMIKKIGKILAVPNASVAAA